jgi:Tol biopolymer transport system component
MFSNLFRLILAATIVLLTLSLAACGSATPTVLPSPTFSVPSLQPTATLVQPTVPPTIPLTSPSPTSTSAIAQPSATATKFAVAVPTATLAVTAVPKPSAPTGRIVYTVVTGTDPKFHTVWIANADGSGAHQILTHARWPALSPDGKRIAYYGTPEGKSAGLYLANADGSNPELIVIDPGVCCINWSRDGNWLVYTVSPRPNQPGGPISTLKVDGAYKTIVSLGVVGNGPAFSPDGKQIVYSGCLPNTSTCGLILVPAGGGAIRQITTDNGGNADWGARGIVYQANDNAGHKQVFFINPDGSGKKQLTNGKNNDGQPVWSRDGGSIFWRSDQNGTAWAIYVMNFDGSNPRRVINNVAPHPDFWGWESLSVGP